MKIMLSKALVFAVIVLFVGAGVVPILSSGNNQQYHDPENWWNNKWDFCKKITINHNMVDANLQNFPVLIHNISSDFSDHAQSDGDDFVFVDSTNTIQYNHEIEHYNSSNGEIIAWVNVTHLSSSEDTTLYLYYGNSISANQENKEETWDSIPFRLSQKP